MIAFIENPKELVSYATVTITTNLVVLNHTNSLSS